MYFLINVFDMRTTLGWSFHGPSGWIRSISSVHNEVLTRRIPGESNSWCGWSMCVCGHWTELRGSLYSIRHLSGFFAAVEQKCMLMPNCWRMNTNVVVTPAGLYLGRRGCFGLFSVPQVVCQRCFAMFSTLFVTQLDACRSCMLI